MRGLMIAPPTSARPGIAAATLALLGLTLGACGNPERELVGCWQQVEWKYEVADDDARSLWTDGVKPREYPDQQVVHHEAEWWRFTGHSRLELGLPGGERVEVRWRLKGRGHALTLRYPDSDRFEVYDVKELNADELILQYDMGMEVRGIARLRFARSPDAGVCQAAHSERRVQGSERSA